MKSLILAGALGASLCAAVCAAFAYAQEPEVPAPAARTPEHEWLQQLVGEWNVTTEATMAPGAEPMRWESTESVRSIGGLWVVGEGKCEFEGMPFTSIMTIGFDPKAGRFVGSWIDTMQSHLWVYRGSLDAEKKTLTLEAEGPSSMDPTKNAQYRDAITVEGPDHKRLESSILGDDGAWVTFMRAEYRRAR